MIHFFHPGLVASCARGDESAGSVFACEPIDKTALDLGIITSLDIVHSADQNSENCDPPCGAPVSGVLPLGYTRVALFVANEGHTAPSTGDALLDQALGSR